MTIEDALRQALRDGGKALTLWPVGFGWQANLQKRDGGWRCVTDSDAVTAILGALGGTPEPETDDQGVFG